MSHPKTMSETDKDLMWAILSNQFEITVHQWGIELHTLAKIRGKSRFKKYVNSCFNIIMTWPIEARARAVKTFLTTYQLPLSPEEIDCFDQFHTTTGNFVLTHANKIKVYQLD